MKSKVFRIVAVAAFAVGMVGSAAPAQATTCAMSDPTLDHVFCDTVYNPVVGTACRAVSKVADCVQ